MVASGKPHLRPSHTDLSDLAGPKSAVPGAPAVELVVSKKKKRSSKEKKRSSTDKDSIRARVR
jgi:hypothetical protein